MIVENNNLFAIYRSDKCDNNPHIIFTFPTSNGHHTDVFNFNVFNPIRDENVIIVMIQTNDYQCFYDPMMSDQQKMMNLDDFLSLIDTVFTLILCKYETKRTPILMGCSMGGYYAQLFYLRHPNKFHCISLGGMCDISILDKNAVHNYSEDRIINYDIYKNQWDHYNPAVMPITEPLHTRLIACFGAKSDMFLMKNCYEFHHRIETWNYIKVYNLAHNFDAWRTMVYDIFKGSSLEFHEFREEFYEDYEESTSEKK